MESNVKITRYEYSESMNMTFADLDTPSFRCWWSVSGNVLRADFLRTAMPAIRAKMERDGMAEELDRWVF